MDKSVETKFWKPSFLQEKRAYGLVWLPGSLILMCLDYILMRQESWPIEIEERLPLRKLKAGSVQQYSDLQMKIQVWLQCYLATNYLPTKEASSATAFFAVNDILQNFSIQAWISFTSFLTDTVWKFVLKSESWINGIHWFRHKDHQVSCDVKGPLFTVWKFHNFSVT